MARAAGKRRAQGTGSVRKLSSSGRWQARYYRPADEPGRPTGKAPHTFDTKGEADGWLRANVGGDSTREVLTDLRLSEYADEWLAAAATSGRHGERTAAESRRQWRHVEPLAAVRLSELTPAAIASWHRKLCPTAPTMRARVYGLLHAILADADREQRLPQGNPCKVRGGHAVTAVHAVPELGVDEAVELFGKLHDELPERYRALVLCASFLTMRFGEIAELRISDIDFGTNTLRISRAVSRVHETGSSVVPVRKGPKSRAGIRTLPLPQIVVEGLRAHIAAGHVADGPDGLVFPARLDATANLAPSTWSRVWHLARARAGYPELHLHDLRHLGGTLLAQTTGASLADLMRWLGHSTPGAAMRYQHSADSRTVSMAASLDALTHRDRRDLALVS